MKKLSSGRAPNAMRLLRIRWRCWLFLSAMALGWPLIAGACEVALEVPESVPVSSWEAAALARGQAAAVPLQLRVRSRGCVGLALGAGVEGSLRAGVRSAPAGQWLGLQPGDPAPLLDLGMDSEQVDLQPELAWAAQPGGTTAGLLTAVVEWRLYQRDGLLERLLQRRRSQLLVQVPALLEVEILGPHGLSPLAGAPTLLDLGRLQSGAQHALMLIVRGNSRAQLSISPRFGELRSAARRNHAIPYDLRLDGVPVAEGMALPLPQPDARGSSVQLELQVGEVERRAAGVYEEVLTLTVAAE